MRAERAMVEGIDWIGEVVQRESIDCGWVKSGAYRIATSAPQLERAKASLEARRSRGLAEEDVRFVTSAEIESEVRIAGVLGGTYTPHCARVDPARLVRGLATACERRGIDDLRGLARDGDRAAAGHLRARQRAAPVVVRATEAFTTRLPGERRELSPSRLAHARHRAPPGRDLGRVGWAGCEPIADQRYQFVYAQRTPDGRIALGGRGLTYRLGGAIREEDEVQPAIHRKLELALRRLFPAAAATALSATVGAASSPLRATGA